MNVNYRFLVQAGQPVHWDFLYFAIFIPAGQDPPPGEVIFQPDLARYVEGLGRPGDRGVLAQEAGAPVGAAWLRLMHGYGFVSEDTVGKSDGAPLRTFRISSRQVSRQYKNHALEVEP